MIAWQLRNLLRFGPELTATRFYVREDDCTEDVSGTEAAMPVVMRRMENNVLGLVSETEMACAVLAVTVLRYLSVLNSNGGTQYAAHNLETIRVAFLRTHVTCSPAYHAIPLWPGRISPQCARCANLATIFNITPQLHADR